MFPVLAATSFPVSTVVSIAYEQLQLLSASRGQKPQICSCNGISILPVIVPFPVSAAILISGCTSMSHLFGEASFELAMTENIDLTAITLHAIVHCSPCSESPQSNSTL